MRTVIGNRLYSVNENDVSEENIILRYNFDINAFKRVSVKIGRQTRLLCPWARHLTGLPPPLSG